MVEVEERELYDCLCRNRHSVGENFVGNYPEHVEQFRVGLDRLSSLVLQFHDRIVHQQLHFAGVMVEISVVVELHFLYSKEQTKHFTGHLFARTHQDQLSSVGF